MYDYGMQWWGVDGNSCGAGNLGSTNDWLDCLQSYRYYEGDSKEPLTAGTSGGQGERACQRHPEAEEQGRGKESRPGRQAEDPQGHTVGCTTGIGRKDTHAAY